MKKTLLDRIKNDFPEISWKKCRLIDHGWDHHVAILDDNLVFRTSKRYDREVPGDFYDEIRLLNYLKKRTTTAIPEYIYASNDCKLAGYRMIPGKELDKRLFYKLTDQEKRTFAKQFAGFITVLHSVPKQTASRFQVRVEDEKKLNSDVVRRIRQKVYPKLKAEHIEIIEDYIKELTMSIAGVSHRVLVHNDLTGEHILWDRKSRQMGVIDFSDRFWGDPAADFTGLVEYGMDFVSKIYDLYGCHKDEGLLHRAELYYKRISLYMMLDSLEGMPCTFKQGYEMFKERFGI
jgi:aminoglycoside phosphotransferase (APT) family kinase protein